jgi:hypothetical protein
MAEEQNDQIITFDDVEYKYSELTNKGKVAVNQLSIIESDIVQTSMLLDRYQAAKETFIKLLKTCLEEEAAPELEEEVKPE